MGKVHAYVANKLCCEMIRVLKDIGVDVLTLGPSDESELPFDYEGVDFLAMAILTGFESWFRKIDQRDWTTQPWYQRLFEFLQLLRG